jgi:hypothetical protein
MGGTREKEKMNKRSMLIGCAILAVFGLGMTGWTPNGSLAAGKHVPEERSDERSRAWKPRLSKDCVARSGREDVALGPAINYPRPRCRFSSSSERYFTGGSVNSIPFRSPAEALEIVPGLAVGR